MKKLSQSLVLARRFRDRFREDGARAAFEATGRNIFRAGLRWLGADPDEDGVFVRNIDFSPYADDSTTQGPRSFDVIHATDLRFPGGSSVSTAQEIIFQHEAGLNSGLIHLPTYKMRNRTSPAPVIDALLRKRQVDLLNSCQDPIHTKVLIVRHPAVLNPNVTELPAVKADQVVLIVNHPPIRLGQIEYLLTHAIRRLRQKYDSEPHVHPIGPLVRRQIDEVYDGTIKLSEDDWVNVFDLERFNSPRSAPAPDRPLRIGRHSRPNIEKWPDTADAIRAAYPDRSDTSVHILGGADIPRNILGRLPANWVTHDFGAMTPEEFLRTIDVFVYFHHPAWIESFGRVIVEAMAAGLPVILPEHFEPLLGEAGIYCEPAQVSDELMRLRDPGYYMQRSSLARAAAGRFDRSVHLARLKALAEAGRPAPIRSRDGMAAALS